MADVTSRRGRIIQALVKQLQTITTDAGYGTTVNEVSLNVTNWAAKPEAETPVLYIIDNRSQYKYNSSKLLEVSMFVSIFGFMRNRTQLEMEVLIADIEKCLDNNRTLSFDGERQLINHHRFTDIITDGQFFSVSEGSQLFRMDVEILYTRCIDDPR
jgi:hypothetical protein